MVQLKHLECTLHTHYYIINNVQKPPSKVLYIQQHIASYATGAHLLSFADLLFIDFLFVSLSPFT